MRIRERRIGKQTYLYLRVNERFGPDIVQRDVYLGKNLALTENDWLGISPIWINAPLTKFKRVSLPYILKACERFVREKQLPAQTLDSLRAAIKTAAHRRLTAQTARAQKKAAPHVNFGQSAATTAACQLLAIDVGATSEIEITRAYRQKARTTHPDAPGGSAEGFRKLVAARDLLLKNLTPTRGFSGSSDFVENFFRGRQ